MIKHETYVFEGKEELASCTKIPSKDGHVHGKNQNPKGVRCQFVNWWPTLIAVVEKLL